MQRLDVGKQPAASTAAGVGASSGMSWRLAPSAAPPIGTELKNLTAHQLQGDRDHVKNH